MTTNILETFRWTKSSNGWCTAANQCSCDITNQRCEKYVLSVGGIYTGIVKSCHGTGITWGATIFIGNDSVTGQSGGEESRDYYMDWVEGQILTWLSELHSVLQLIDVEAGVERIPKRVIYTALYERDNDGVLRQKKVT